MAKPKLLDLFCGAGGAAMGYERAGFEVVGVDIKPQPHYPFEFHQADALSYPLDGFNVIHASPPCQAYVNLSNGKHPKLIEPIRTRLQNNRTLYVIENVCSAPLENPILLCGSHFGLGVRRHRLFESPGLFLLNPDCNHRRSVRAYYGHSGWLVWKGRQSIFRGSIDQAPADMGIGWMKTWGELRESIPPAYTEFIGKHLI